MEAQALSQKGIVCFLFHCLHIAFNFNSCIIAFLLTTFQSVDDWNWHWHRHWLEVELRQTAHLKTTPNAISKELTTILGVNFLRGCMPFGSRQVSLVHASSQRVSVCDLV